MTAELRPQLVTRSSALTEVCDRLAAAGRFAFDTEFVGEDTYEAQVCLIQAATADFCALIDPLEGLDLTPLWDLLADGAVRVVLHAAVEDLTIFHRSTGRLPAGIADTQIMAGFVGFGYPISLSRLAKLTVQANLRKSQTLTDWRRRPLSKEQITYAAADVAYLPGIDDAISRRLATAGRTSWAEEECAALCNPATLTIPPQQKLRRLRGAGSLNRRELAIADALLREREALAKVLNRPPRAVLRDHLVAEMAKHGWTDIARLRSLRGVSLNKASLQRLAQAVETALALPADAWPEQSNDEDEPIEDVLIGLLTSVLRNHCHESDLAFSLVANKQDLRAFVRAHTRKGPAEPSRLETGWRAEAVGDLLTDLLSGRKAIRIHPHGPTRSVRVE